MSYHILVAEDDPFVLDVLVRALMRIKPAAAITSVMNGVDALQHFKTAKFDLVISDHRMPRMSGLDLLLAIRKDSMVPFIMLSADSTVEEIAHVEGVTLFFGKPISLEILRPAVLQLLPD